MAEKQFQKPTDVPDEEIQRMLEEKIASFDSHRVESLARLDVLRTAKGAQLEREKKRLARKLGDEHPRVVRIDARLATNARLARDLNAELQKATVESPASTPDTYVLHGFVRDEMGRGVPDLTVALYDPTDGSWLRAFGHACTDKKGYFRFTTKGKPEAEKAQVKVEQARQAPTGLRQPEARWHAELRVLDKKRTVVHVSGDPVYPQLGKVEYREIVLDISEVPCQPPREEEEGPPPEERVPAPGKPSRPRRRRELGKLPVERVNGIGPVYAKRLNGAGIVTVKDFQEADNRLLEKTLGRNISVVKRLKRNARRVTG
jgi:hypothetical protein